MYSWLAGSGNLSRAAWADASTRMPSCTKDRFAPLTGSIRRPDGDLASCTAARTSVKGQGLSVTMDPSELVSFFLATEDEGWGTAPAINSLATLLLHAEIRVDLARENVRGVCAASVPLGLRRGDARRAAGGAGGAAAAGLREVWQRAAGLGAEEWLRAPWSEGKQWKGGVVSQALWLRLGTKGPSTYGMWSFWDFAQ